MTGINWIIGFSKALFLSYENSGRDLILNLGEMYLLGKNTSEIHYKIEVDNKEIKKFRVVLQNSNIKYDILF